MNTLKNFAATLALFGLACVPCTQAKESRDEEGGASEHYHHEFYSHSYVDSNYREDEKTNEGGNAPLSKNGRSHAKPKSGFTFAFGGHRHPQHPQ